MEITQKIVAYSDELSWNDINESLSYMNTEGWVLFGLEEMRVGTLVAIYQRKENWRPSVTLVESIKLREHFPKAEDADDEASLLRDMLSRFVEKYKKASSAGHPQIDVPVELLAVGQEMFIEAVKVLGH